MKAMATIDLNADLGEDPESVRDGRDEAILAVVTSANVACGGHAGDEGTMEATVLSALHHGVAVGAHPSYPDRARFGRAVVSMSSGEIEDVVFSQVCDLGEVASRLDARIVHVKPHGALYGACAYDTELAGALAEGVARWCRSLRLFGPVGSPALETWQRLGFEVVAEAFADRRYEPDGTLRDRSFPDAVISDPEEAAAQALAIATGTGVKAIDGTRLGLLAASICVHGDTPGAVAIARTVRRRLEDAGVVVQAPSL